MMFLKQNQRDLNITSWLIYFTNLISNSFDNTIGVAQFTILKNDFLQKIENEINTRQKKVITKMLNAGKDGFLGGMTEKKYVSINKTSKATATRDLQDLVEKNILKSIGAGRSVRYELESCT